MPKHGFLTPKAIANRIKSKGLQKLRWYCQMCQKQCRDENGFKCHTTSESHQRQLLLFAENPDKYIDSFSKEFMDDFMHLLKRRFGTKRVHANQVYQEFIADRNHLHMNSTQWETLTEFVKWLGREGHCNVDETEKGWFICYIDRDPETIARQEILMKQEKMKLDDEERMAKFFQRQMERDKETSQKKPDAVYTELLKNNEEEKVTFAMKTVIKTKSGLNVKPNPLASTSSSSSKNVPSKKAVDEGKRKMALDEIMEQEERYKEKKSRKDFWLSEGIDVKVITKNLGKDVFEKKAVVKEVVDRYKAVIKFHESREKTLAHQSDLKTVIPAIGRKVLILNGVYRGCEATLLDVNFERFCTKVKISSGAFKGKVIDSVSYEDVSKLHKQS